MSKSDSKLFSGTWGSPQIKLNYYQPISQPDFYGGAGGRPLPAKYKDWIGTNQFNRLYNQATNLSLKNAIKQLYRPTAYIGDGGTADAIRFEKATGLGLGKNGGTHIKKGEEMVRYIENKILTQNLSDTDRELAQKLIDDLKKALGGN